MPPQRREVTLTREAIRGLYAFERGAPTLEAIGKLFDAMKQGQMPTQAKPLADLPHGYEVVINLATIVYEDLPQGAVRVLTIERAASAPGSPSLQ